MQGVVFKIKEKKTELIYAAKIYCIKDEEIICMVFINI